MKNKSFCILPFIHLATHPIGTVTPCCVTDMTDDMSTATRGNEKLFLDKDSLSDIANSKKFNTIRQKMMDNEYPAECKSCYHHDKNGVYSKRMESNNKFKHLIDDSIKNTNEDGTLKDVNYKYLELRLGTVCNMKCITCNPFSSSKWNEDVSAFKDTKFEKLYFKCDDRTNWYRSIKFYDELLEHTTELEEVWINGGEPTLIKEHGYFLEKLIERGDAQKINLHYSLNLTNIPDTFIELWMKFKNVRIQLSIDDLFGRNEYIRTGSNWDVTYENFMKMLKYDDVFSLEVCQTLSVLNVFNIDAFKRFTQQHNIIVSHNYVNYPSFLHVSNVPEEMKVKIIDNLTNLRADEVDRLKLELHKNNNNEFDKFYEYINLLDSKRNTNIIDHLSEWVTYF